MRGVPMTETRLMAADTAPEQHPDPAQPGSGGEGAHDVRLSIREWAKVQSLAGAVVLILASPWGVTGIYSAMLGGLSVSLPAFFFAVYTGRRIGASSSAFLLAAVVGEALKLFLIAVFCMAVFRWVRPLTAGAFFMGMILMIVAGWVAQARGLKTAA